MGATNSAPSREVEPEPCLPSQDSEPDIQSCLQLLCCDTLWADTTSAPPEPWSLTDEQKTWLGPYFKFCTKIFEDLPLGKDAPGYSSALRKEEIRSTLRQLRSRPSITKEALRTFIRGTREDNVPTNSEIDRSISFAVKLMLMVNCSYPDHDSPSITEEGRAEVFWGDGPQNTFIAFVDDSLFHSALPEATRTSHPLAHRRNPAYSQAILKLRARKLKKVLGVSFQTTDNLANHLKYDERRRKVYIFHHAGFLKHQLALTGPARVTGESQVTGKSRVSLEDDAEKSLKLGAIPRRLALEVLWSLQVVLFPLADPKSTELLRETIGQDDAQIKINDRETQVPNEEEKNINFHYLLDRLAYLHDRAKEAPPTSRFWNYFHYLSQSRHLMMVTAMGILISLVFGVVSIGLAARQLRLAHHELNLPQNSEVEECRN
ncbi:hypothetical protein QBC39DRAFT_312742 [Podospora conica]|nr:hypothetical protein QBC39DRAFT_312742 [Schizothecium conicum]